MTWLMPPETLATYTAAAVARFLALGGILALLIAWGAVLAAAAARARHRLSASRGFARWHDRVAGGALVALGLKLAFARR